MSQAELSARHPVRVARRLSNIEAAVERIEAPLAEREQAAARQQQQLSERRNDN